MADELTDGGYGRTLADDVRASRLPTDPLTPGEIRALLRECVTVVAPGETLIIRVLSSLTMQQVAEYQRSVNVALEYLGCPFKALVLPAEGLGIATGPSLPERVRTLATRDRTHG
jgi:hypothetical protein